MGFILYKVEKTDNAVEYSMCRRLAVAGTSGALSKWLLGKTGEEDPFKWDLSGPALVAALAPDVDPASHAVVMDMMPERLSGASLCLVSSLAGFSEYDETDLIIVLRELSMHCATASSADPRLRFTVSGQGDAPDLIESIGLSGGTRKGTFRWCAPKMNIGAAVCQAKPQKNTFNKAAPSGRSLVTT
jgi:hypothetical protein